MKELKACAVHIYPFFFPKDIMQSEYLNNKFFESVIHRFQKSKQDKLKFQFIIEDLTICIDSRKKHNQRPHHDIDYYNTEHKKAISEFDVSQKELAKAFYKLSENLVIYAKDIITDTDDAIQEGVMICFEKIDRFNPEKGKAFNYMTTCILNHLRQMYRTSKNYRLLKERYKDFLIYKLDNVMIRNGKEKYYSDSIES